MGIVFSIFQMRKWKPRKMEERKPRENRPEVVEPMGPVSYAGVLSTTSLVSEK